MTLYELTNDYAELLLMAEDPDTDPQAFADTLEGIEGAIEDKADGYAKVIRQIRPGSRQVTPDRPRSRRPQQADRAKTTSTNEIRASVCNADDRQNQNSRPRFSPSASRRIQRA